jgi:hypothetical protein
MHPSDLRNALIKEKRKKFAIKWFTKFNAYKKNLQEQQLNKKCKSSSAIGEERMK